ncbi:MAG TPA: transcription termination/antitermination protein NusG [Clostridiales bacterium]|nr:transcription termination/antitermination protein NusG [Clostridiales bacterium]
MPTERNGSEEDTVLRSTGTAAATGDTPSVVEDEPADPTEADRPGQDGGDNEDDRAAETAAEAQEEQEEEEGGGEAHPDHPEKKWYVVHTYSGYEGKVKKNLEKRIESMLMQDKIFRIIVPTEDQIEYKDGRKLISKKKIFPGYVLVEMVMNDDSWYVVRNTPGVTGFVGSGTRPVPLEPSEVRSILRHMGVDEPRPKVIYERGESVKVISGPFMGFIGKVKEINLDKGKLRVSVSMFGRETPVELDFSQVEKL